MRGLGRIRRWLAPRLKPDPNESIYSKYREFTMMPRECFLDYLHLVERVRALPGCVVECGVWRGGACAATAEILGPHRTYYLFDSFEGLPPAQEIDGPHARAWQADTTSAHYHDNCRAEERWAREAMALAGVQNPKLVRGWFSDTVRPGVVTESIALLRLDGDWYESTKTCLEALYDSVCDGGLIVLDDYYSWDGCSIALHEFLAARKSSDRIRLAYTVGTGGGCYLVKGGR